MKLKITKFQDKKHVLKYVRDNGTETWMHSDNFFVLHDLSHFALEKTLGYTTAFCGMLNSGISIEDFEDRNIRNAMLITKEAIYAENMANLFLMETVQGNFDDMNAVIKEAHETITNKLPAPVLTATQIEGIRTNLQEVLTLWKNLPEGNTLVVDFVC
jgi:hypothetical protein